jgi:hypothetical protein
MIGDIMNERIRELAEQATVPFKDENLFECYHFSKEKFALLLIQECLTVVNDTPVGYRDYRNQIEEGMRDACVDRLKNHFGVNS